MFGMFCPHLQGKRISWEWKEMYLIQRRRARSSETLVSNCKALHLRRQYLLIHYI
jgi:hypothetical protein